MACTVADAVSGSVVELLVAAIRASPDDDATSTERKSDGNGASLIQFKFWSSVYSCLCIRFNQCSTIEELTAALSFWFLEPVSPNHF